MITPEEANQLVTKPLLSYARAPLVASQRIVGLGHNIKPFFIWISQSSCTDD
jgi:hypothetical protein